MNGIYNVARTAGTTEVGGNATVSHDGGVSGTGDIGDVDWPGVYAIMQADIRDMKSQIADEIVEFARRQKDVDPDIDRIISENISDLYITN